MYLIWNDQIWLTTDPRWAPYNDCAGDSGDPTACHRDHIHFSFSRGRGAQGDHVVDRAGRLRFVGTPGGRRALRTAARRT